MFHLARMVGAACMGLSLFHFYKITLGDDRQANLAWIFALFGSGLGWVVGLLGGFTMDFWVAEAYPFLAAYANPHFPLSIALVVHLLAISRQNQPASLLQAVVGSLALAILQPFGVALLIVILGFEVLAGIFRRKPILWKFILAVGIGGLMGWMAAGLVFLVLPFGLQRRFLLGFFVPLAGLAVIGIQSWLSARSVNWEKACVWLLVVSLPTNLLVLATGAVGILTHPTQLYLTRGEAYAMQWIRASTAVGAIIVASPESGLLIPAHTGRRVFYGHPYETVNAEREKSDIEEALKSINAETTLAVLKSRGADYLFWGQRERDIQPIAGFQPDLPVVFSSNEVKIYSLPP
jgi:hypothetical protein